MEPMDWLRRFGPTIGLAVAAVIALALAVVLTFAGAEADGGRTCGSLWSRDDTSAACDEELDGRADARLGAGATSGVAALGAGGLWLRERHRQRRAVIETPRLRLRRCTPADALEVGRTLDDDTLTALRWSAPDRETIVATISSGRSSTIWVAAEKETERIVGAITAPPNSQHQHAVTLGFWIASDVRGQGLMPEAIRALVQRLHGDGVTVIDATVPEGNQSAIQALDAAEFRVQRRQGDLVVYRSERRAIH